MVICFQWRQNYGRGGRDWTEWEQSRGRVCFQTPDIRFKRKKTKNSKAFPTKSSDDDERINIEDINLEFRGSKVLGK